MLLMPQPASAAASVKTAPSAAMRRKPWPSMEIAPGSRRARDGGDLHGPACGDRFVAAKGGDGRFLPATELRPIRAHPWQTTGFSSRQRRDEFFKRAQGEGAHVGAAIAAAGPQCQNPLHGTRDGDAGV